MKRPTPPPSGSPSPNVGPALTPLALALEANRDVLKVAADLMRDIEALPLPRQAKERLSERYGLLDRKVTKAIKALDLAVDAYAAVALPNGSPPSTPTPAAGGSSGVC